MHTGDKIIITLHHHTLNIRWPATTWGIDNAPPPKSKWSLSRLAKKVKDNTTAQDTPKRGRRERKTPYIIPEMPTDTSSLSRAELNRIRKQIATEQNKVASQKYRQRRAQRESEKAKELGLLEQKKLRMQLLESRKICEIRRIKDFFNKKIKDKCVLCQSVLTTIITQSMPMVTMKVEMVNLDSIKKEIP